MAESSRRPWIRPVARDQLTVWRDGAYADIETQRQLVGDLVDRAFGGSAARLVQQALSSKKASPGEIARIRKFLDELERSRK